MRMYRPQLYFVSVTHGYMHSSVNLRRPHVAHIGNHLPGGTRINYKLNFRFSMINHRANHRTVLYRNPPLCAGHL
jgi:hypothetical protein